MAKRKIDFERTSIRRALVHIAVSMALSYAFGRFVGRPLTDRLVPLAYKDESFGGAHFGEWAASQPDPAAAFVDALRQELAKEDRFRG